MTASRYAGYAPVMLSILRIVAALIFIEHGTQKLFGFPPGSSMPPPETMSMLWWAGIIELIPGALVCIGLFTRVAAFLAAGEMAFAYWLGHFPRDFWPVNNDGDAAILYCFVFLYISMAGPGPWSIDAMRPERPPASEEG